MWRCCIVLFLISLLTFVHSCYIQGTDSGYCSEETLDGQFRVAKMPYCAKFVVYPACLPKLQQIPPLKAFPRGRWYNHTVDNKDSWLQEHVEDHIGYRKSVEQNESLINSGRNEHGEAGTVEVRFYKKTDCMNAFRAMACYMNFPRCDPATGMSMPTCRSACENFFIACGYEKDLYRCGRSKFFNGYEAEIPEGNDVNGTPIYLRDFFPGQPFRQNKFDKDYQPVAVCTPSIFGSATSLSPSYSTVIFLIALTVYTVHIVNHEY